MLRVWGDTPDSTPPCSRPVYERVLLAQRIALARTGIEPLAATWDQLAAETGVPKRTLQHFWRRWGEDLSPFGSGKRPSRHARLYVENRDVFRIWPRPSTGETLASGRPAACF